MLSAETGLQNWGPSGGCLQKHRNLAEQAEDSYLLPLCLHPLYLSVCTCGCLVSESCPLAFLPGSSASECLWGGGQTADGR